MMKHLKVTLLSIGIASLILFSPVLVTAFQKTPTDYANNITGRITSQITASQTTGITVTADTYRTPAGTAATGQLTISGS